MHVVVLVFLAVTVSALQSTSLAHAANAPDLIVVLVVWVVNNSGLTAGWLRAWAIGVVAGGMIPGSGMFTVFAALVAAMTAKTCGRILDRHHVVGQWVAGSLAVLAVAVVDVLSAGLAPGQHWLILESAAWSGGLLAVLSWLMSGVPRDLWPVAQRESAW